MFPHRTQLLHNFWCEEPGEPSPLVLKNLLQCLGLGKEHTVTSLGVPVSLPPFTVYIEAHSGALRADGGSFVSRTPRWKKPWREDSKPAESESLSGPAK